MKQAFPTESDFLTAWIKLSQVESNTEEYEENFWAFQKMSDFIFEDPEIAWELVLKILEKDSSSKVMENLSAGPLEDLLASHGSKFIERIENEAKNNPEFASLLGGVWQNSMPDEIWKRVQLAWNRDGWDGIPENKKQET